MFSKRRLHGVLTALTLLVLFSGSAGAQLPEPFVFRNDTSTAVVVHLSSVIRGKIVRHRPLTLLPKAVTPPLTVPGNKVVVIYDGRLPTKAVFQGTIPATAPEAIYSIYADPLTQRIDVQRVLPMP
jgi:hypothetical protein